MRLLKGIATGAAGAALVSACYIVSEDKPANSAPATTTTATTPPAPTGPVYPPRAIKPELTFDAGVDGG